MSNVHNNYKEAFIYIYEELCCQKIKAKLFLLYCKM